VESPQQIRDYVTNAVGEALDVLARDVELRIHAPEGVLVEPLSLFRSHRRGEVTVVELGDLVSEQELRLVLKVNFPFGRAGERVAVEVSLADRDGILDPSSRQVEWWYADGAANDRQVRHRDVDREVARLYAARGRKEAAALNKRGDYAAANAALQGVARRIRGYAGSDPELLALVDSLRGEEARLSAPMAAADLKTMHYGASYLERGRDVQGRARKNPGSSDSR
jgi:hypothetical protein